LKVILAATTFGSSYLGDGTSGLYLWGAQLNTGPLAPYVPTGALTASSTADVASITGAAFAGIYNTVEATLWGVVSGPKGTVLFGVGDTFDNTVYATVSTSSNVSFRSGGADQAILSAAVATTGETRIAVAYKANDFAAVSNGGAVSVDNSGSVPVGPVRFSIGSSSWQIGGNQLNGYIRELAIFKSRRPNANLQAMTS